MVRTLEEQRRLNAIAARAAEEVDAEMGIVRPISYKSKPIDYIDIAPKPLLTQISLAEYFERIKRHRADRWQKDFCNRLQTAIETRHIKSTWAEFHAEAQLGKTTILSQAFPAWCFGHDPLFRYALAMYNVTRSQTHSQVIIQILQSKIHKEIFPNKDGHLPNNVSKAGWMTNARLDFEHGSVDGQLSLNPVGLQSGLTGSGFDWLTIDDPYKEAKEAFSETVGVNLANFWEYTVEPRLSQHSCIAAMFHRYSPDDFGGYLLDTGRFDYVRYATICDGSYIHDDTGQKFDDPLGREIGEYISPERRSPEYYTEKRKNNLVWLSMFQGRPSSEEGEFFKVGQIETVRDTEQRKQECSVLVRAWDLAATELGGDYSVGVLLGIDLSGNVTIFDVVREQVETAGRDALQLATARKDGAGVVVTVPKDPGAAGDTTVFHIQQLLKGFEVVPRSTSGSKEDRARSLASAVNSGDVSFADADWNKVAKKEMRNFPLSENDDIVDAMADAYNEAFIRIKKGLVIKDFRPQRNLITRSEFKERFPYRNDPKVFKIPDKWTTYVGIKITSEASTPNSAVIVTRASEHARMSDTLFVVAEYKEYTADVYHLFEWVKTTLDSVCTNPKISLLWLHGDSADFQTLIRQKLQYGARVFKDDIFSGLVDAAWFLQPLETEHPFNPSEKASRMYAVVDDDQLDVAMDARGLYGFRQEMVTWGFNDRNEPSKVGAVLDCLRMVTNKFRTRSETMTFDEKVDLAIPEFVKTMVERAETAEDKLTATLTMEFERSVAEDSLRPPDYNEYEDSDLWI